MKVSVIVAVMIAAIIVVIILFTGRKMDIMIREIAGENADVADRVFASKIQSWQEETLDHAALIAQSHEILDSIQNNDTANLQRMLGTTYQYGYRSGGAGRPAEQRDRRAERRRLAGNERSVRYAGETHSAV